MWKKTGKFALFIAIVWINPALANAQNELNATDEAIDAAERLVAAIGGEEIWANARTVYVEEKAWPPSLDHMIVEEVWRDVNKPRQFFRLKGFKTERGVSERAFDENQGWIHNSLDEFRVMEAEEHAREVLFAFGDVYIMYHRLAAGDSNLNLTIDDNSRLVIKGVDGQNLGWFELDVNGAPMRWGLDTGEESVEYVFGPLKDFGNVRFPAWGAATDSSWRYEYIAVEVTDQAPPISFYQNSNSSFPSSSLVRSEKTSRIHNIDGKERSGCCALSYNNRHAAQNHLPPGLLWALPLSGEPIPIPVYLDCYCAAGL